MEAELKKRQPEANAHFLKGIALQKAEKYNEAVAEYDEAVLTYPRCPEVHYNRGLAFRKLGKLDNAIIDYSQAILLDPRFAGRLLQPRFHVFQARRTKSRQ